MSGRRKKSKSTGDRVWLLVILTLFLAGVVWLRFLHRGTTDTLSVQERPSPAITETVTLPLESAQPATDMPPVQVTEKPVQELTQESKPLSRLSFTQAHYTNRTYQLVSDMVYTYQHLQSEGNAEIRRMIEQLQGEDPTLGAIWDEIMSYWDYANTDMPVEPGVLPEGLPEDDSLCFVVLGYQLYDDGTMAPELIGRCELALACAEKYPNAYIAVTGGGTALKEKSATEAGMMASWLITHGVAAERIITEDASLTTHQNARNTAAILTDSYPQVQKLAVVTSDYHMPLGCLMFTEISQLYRYGNDRAPFEVVANVAYGVPDGEWGLWGPYNQAQYVWNMAAPEL